MTTWWQEHDDFVRANRSGHDQTLAPHLVALLDDVEARFVAAGGDAMRWDDPHAIPGDPFDRRDSLEEEYSRLTDPGKYSIVEVRMDAWVRALTAPNVENDGVPLADVAYRETDMRTPGDEAGAGTPTPSRIRTLTPRDGAPELRLTTWMHDAELLLFRIEVGTPAVEALTSPPCVCDACDSGSEYLLKEIDQWILSIVDGSFEIIERGHDRTDRTSFGGNRRWDHEETYPSEISLTGRSWWPGKRSRPLIRMP